MNNYTDWLEYRATKNVDTNDLDMYLIAFEGWKRGLKVTWYLKEINSAGFIGEISKEKITYSLEKNKKKHYFYKSLGDEIQNKEVIRSSNNKNITNNKELEFYQDDNKSDKLVEETDLGKEYWAYIVNHNVEAITEIKPLYVVGNGKSTLKDLIEIKNEQRRKNPFYKNKLIEFDKEFINFLSEKNITLNHIIKQDEKVFLNTELQNIKYKETIGVTNNLNEKIKSNILNLSKNIEGFKQGTIKFISNDKNITIKEINVLEDIAIHMFPLAGKSQNLPAKIIDYYFPKTSIGVKNNIYFDYQDIKKELINGRASSITIKNIPKKKLYMKRFIVKGKVQSVGYRKWIRRQAVRYGIHGYIRNLKNGNVVIVIANEDEENLEQFKKICKKGPKRAKVEQIEELSWNNSVKLGFIIKKTK